MNGLFINLELRKLKEEENIAFDAKQQAFAKMEKAWKNFQDARYSNDQEIIRLKTIIDTWPNKEARTYNDVLSLIRRRNKLMQDNISLQEVQIHKDAVIEYKECKKVYIIAKEEFDRRYAELKPLEYEERLKIARLAKVPPEFENNIWVKFGEDGDYIITFGGIDGKPFGKNNGLIRMSQDGIIAYRRNPGES